MYPLYWIASKGGILMRYSYEFKRKAIELFYQGELLNQDPTVVSKVI